MGSEFLLWFFIGVLATPILHALIVAMAGFSKILAPAVVVFGKTLWTGHKELLSVNLKRPMFWINLALAMGSLAFAYWLKFGG